MVFRAVTPEDASTVILLREDRGSLEVYMTRRQDYLKFMGGYYVFPGGKVDDADRGSEVMARCRDFDPDRARERLDGVSDSRRSFGFFVAGARELFEEAGILLARDEGGSILESLEGERSARLAARRERLQHDRMSFAQVLAREGLLLDPSRLLWFAHWITPATSPRRFSTFFFLTKKPSGQRTAAFKEEVAEALWVRPEDALTRWREGVWPMIPPTISSLDTLSGYRSWDDLAADFSLPPGEFQRTVWKGF